MTFETYETRTGWRRWFSASRGTPNVFPTSPGSSPVLTMTTGNTDIFSRALALGYVKTV